jgi:hypothetical protein
MLIQLFYNIGRGSYNCIFFVDGGITYAGSLVPIYIRESIYALEFTTDHSFCS